MIGTSAALVTTSLANSMPGAGRPRSSPTPRRWSAHRSTSSASSRASGCRNRRAIACRIDRRLIGGCGNRATASLAVRDDRLRRRLPPLSVAAAASWRRDRRWAAVVDRRGGDRGRRAWQQAALLARRSRAHAPARHRSDVPHGRQDRRRRSRRRPDRRRSHEEGHRRPRIHRRSLRRAARARHRHRPHRLLPRGTAGSHLWVADVAAVGRRLRRRHRASSDAALRSGVPRVARVVSGTREPARLRTSTAISTSCSW